MQTNQPFANQSFAIQPFATLFGAGRAPAGEAGTTLPIKRVSAATRTAQALGIEWYDTLRQARDASVEAARDLAAAKSPGAALAIQAAYLRGAGARWASQAPVLGDLYGQVLRDLMGLPPVAAPAKLP